MRGDGQKGAPVFGRAIQCPLRKSNRLICLRTISKVDSFFHVRLYATTISPLDDRHANDKEQRELQTIILSHVRVSIAIYR